MIGSLFSGIGGLELGLEAAGLGPVAWQVESDPFCRAVLARHWPQAERFDDVRTVGVSRLRRVRGVCGGFPCQDVSSAGERRGLAGARSGLWYEYARIVDEISPEWVVVENVTSGEAAWLPHVRHDLLRLGYRTEAHRLGAMDVGAPHRRMRTFVLGIADGSRRTGARWSGSGSERAAAQQPDCAVGDARPEGRGREQLGAGASIDAAARRGETLGDPDPNWQHEPQGVLSDEPGRATDAGRGPLAHAHRFDGGLQPGRGLRTRGAADPAQLADADPRRATTAIGAVGGVPDGLSARLDGHRWPAGRGQAQRKEEPPRAVARGEIEKNAARLRALGNAVVPQVARLIGLRLVRLLEAGA